METDRNRKVLKSDGLIFVVCGMSPSFNSLVIDFQLPQHKASCTREYFWKQISFERLARLPVPSA